MKELRNGSLIGEDKTEHIAVELLRRTPAIMARTEHGHAAGLLCYSG